MTTMEDVEQRVAEYRMSSVLLIFVVPALGGLLFGYDIGATAFVIQQLQSSVYSGVSWYGIVASRPFLVGVIVAISAVGAFASSWMVFQLNDKIGRRQELRVGATLYAVGAAGAALSGVGMLGPLPAIASLILGRFIYGCGIGFTMHGAPTYIAEMSPPSIRGTLISLKEAAIVLGILCGYGLGYAVEHTVGGWMYQYAASIPVAGTVIALSLYIPRSARWLVLKGLEDEAHEALQFIFVVDEEVQHAMDEMLEQQKEENHVQRIALERGHRDSIFSPSRRAPLIAGVGLIVLQQITGQPSVLSYATVIFESIGLGGFASVVVAVFKLLATLSAAITVEKFGRKSLLYVGCSLMLAALITLVFSLANSDSMDDTMGTKKSGVTEIRQIATLVAMFVYIGGYQVGFGPISWLMISEVFPLSIRGQAVAFSVQMNFFLNFVVQLGVPILQSAVGLSLTFGIFGLFTVYSLYFVYRYVPETKGLSLEEIEQQFKTDSNESSSVEGLASVPLLDSAL